MQTHEPIPATPELPPRGLPLKEHRSDPNFSELELVALTGSRIEMGAAETAVDFANGITTEEELAENVAVTKNALKIVDGLDPEATLHEQVSARLARVDEQLERGAKGVTAKILERDKAALQLVHDVYGNISITGRESAGAHLKGAERAAAQREYVNQCIGEHNEFISRSPAEAQDTPQPVLTPPAPVEVTPTYDPAQTVIDARESVANAFRPSTETAPKDLRTKEALNEKLLEDVLIASRGTTLVHTDLPSSGPDGSEPKFMREGTPSSSVKTGFRTVGDKVGANYEALSGKSYLLNMPGVPMAVEGVFHAPLKEDVYTMQAQNPVRGRFGRTTTPPPVRVKTGERPVVMVNPISGQPEQAVEVTYQFNSQDLYKSPIGGKVEYRTQSGRPGNMLVVQATLPKSIAHAMVAEAGRNPQFARTFAQRLTVGDRTGMTAEDWNGKPGEHFKVKPPYDTLPAGWTLSIYDEANGTETKAAF